MAGLGILVAAVQMSRWTHLEPHERATYDSIDAAVGGWHLAQLAIGVLGVLVITGEYSTGMIRSSLMAVPRRLPVLWAKIGVFAAVTFVLMLIASVHLVLRRPGDRRPSTIAARARRPRSAARRRRQRAVPDGARDLGLALGALVRNTAGGIALFVGLLFVLPGIIGDPAGERRRRDQPLPAAQRRDRRWPRSPSTTATTSRPWGGFAVFCGYTALAVAAAAVALLRRDA